MTKGTKAVDPSRLPEATQVALGGASEVEQLGYSGVAGNTNIEDNALYADLPNEKIVERHKSSIIVMGSDRPDNTFSGLGGRGASKVDRIHLIAGLGGRLGSGKDFKVTHPNHKKDSSFIYLTAGTQLDEFFDLPEYTNFVESEIEAEEIESEKIKIQSTAMAINKKIQVRSGIFMKSDNIRIVGRETVRIYAYSDKKNSLDGNASIGGVHILTGTGPDAVGPNKDGKMILQPMVKGTNLTDFLFELIDNITMLSSLVDALTYEVGAIAIDLQEHKHLVKPEGKIFVSQTSDELAVSMPGVLCMLQVEVREGIVGLCTNLDNLSSNWLLPSAGDDCINSKYNKVN